MKKLLLLFIIIISFISPGRAQQWSPPGATWQYKYSGTIAGITGYAQFKYVADTVINNNSCKKISASFHGTLMSVVYTHTVVPVWKSYFTYENNGVVHLYTGGAFDTVVNANAAIGDKWLRPRSNYESECNSRQAVVVIDTGHVVINGLNLKKIVTTYTNSYGNGSQTYSVSITQTILPRFLMYAGDYAGNDMFPRHCEMENTIGEFPSAQLVCYRDNNFTLSPSNSCTDIVGISTKIEIIKPLTVYPNPAQSALFFEKGNQTGIESVQVRDVLGGQVLMHQINDKPVQELDVSSLVPGVYFLHLTGNSGEVVKRFVKE
jgi:hypothetical protein